MWMSNDKLWELELVHSSDHVRSGGSKLRSPSRLGRQQVRVSLLLALIMYILMFSKDNFWITEKEVKGDIFPHACMPLTYSAASLAVNM